MSIIPVLYYFKPKTMTKQIKITLQDEAILKLEQLAKNNSLSVSYFLNKTIMEFEEQKLTKEILQTLLDNLNKIWVKE